MNQPGLIVHISGQDSDRQDQLAHILMETLRERGYSPAELSEQSANESLGSMDDPLLARAVGWASRLLAASGALVLVLASPSFGRLLALLPDYTPGIELSLEQEFVTAAPQRLALTANPVDLPQEIARAVLVLETAALACRGDSPTQPTGDDSVYTAEEEALIEEHLRSLGYL